MATHTFPSNQYMFHFLLVGMIHNHYHNFLILINIGITEVASIMWFGKPHSGFSDSRGRTFILAY
jgi:hypothetical protein